ncbi:MAG: PTS sugar transporter subunit IIC [Ruminococcaceae bacterium]|nr:PTS sugar transporter subunit IIC [Oscillospiraceae bacterium]
MKEKIKAYLKRYFIDAMGAMAQGLFASLLIGTIFNTLGTYLGLDFLCEINNSAKAVTGAAIGVAIAYSLKAHPLVIYSSAAVGYLANALGVTIGDKNPTAGPAGAFFAVIIAAEIGMLVSRRTKVDILVTPTVTILVGFGAARLLCPGIAYLMYYLGEFVNTATELQPFFMGIIVSVVVGVVLTLPISSAALCAMIGITGIAGGAAAVGCCCQMVGFAVCSFRENKWNGLVSQGLGTSMLQMGNICRRPQIWIPPTLAAAVCGPVSTMVFKLKCTGVSAGMGTCGMVGPIGIITDSGTEGVTWAGVALCCIVLPAVVSLAVCEIMRKVGWIRFGDMKLDT